MRITPQKGDSLRSAPDTSPGPQTKKHFLQEYPPQKETEKRQEYKPNQQKEMILRNFLTTLRRFKMASGLNIVGLSIAFAAFVLILMQVSYENGFDKGYPQQVYRVETI